MSRQARYATSAVRNSLQMLSLQEDPNSTNCNTMDEDIPVLLRKSMRLDKKSSVSQSQIDTTLPTDKLEFALLKLVTMWHVIEELLLQLIDSNDTSGCTIELMELKESLETACGELSLPVTKHNRHEQDRFDRVLANTGATATSKDGNDTANVTPPPQPNLFQYLTMSDINLITERFELGGSVDRKQFLAYFSNISNKLKLVKQYQHHGNTNTINSNTNDNKATQSISRTIVTASASPFRASSEWSQLKAKTLEVAVDVSIPHRRKFDGVMYASEFAEAKHKQLPLPQEQVKLELFQSTPSQPSQPTPIPMTNDEFDDLVTGDDSDSESERGKEKDKAAALALAELAKTKAAEVRRREDERRRIAEADAIAAQKSTKMVVNIEKKNYNRVLDAYSKDQPDFEDES